MKHILFAIFWCVMSFSAPGAFAAAVGKFQDVSGEVKIQLTGGAPQVASKDTPLESGASVTTGEKSYAVLRFDDGQVFALQSNSQFQIQDYRYNPANAQQSSIFVSLFKGGMRAVTGAIASQNKAAFKLQTPQATIGIRGTDFPVVLKEGLYALVLDGAIELQSAGRTLALDTCFGAFMALGGALPDSVHATTLPAEVFAEILAVPLGAHPRANVPYPCAAATNSSSVPTSVLIGIGLGVVGVAAAASGGSNSTTHH